mgnify:CR=1 FL=1
MKEFIFMQNISNMFERYYSNEKNVKNEPLEENEKIEFQEISKKFKKGITEECYKKYKYIKSDMLEISSKFENAIYISRKIKDNTYEPTKILKSEIKKWDYFDFKEKYSESIEKVEYFLPIYRLGILYFDLETENPFLNELEGILIDMTSIRNNLLQKKVFYGLENLEKIDDLIKEQKAYDKKILDIMGMFLAIFSVIGISASSVLNLQNNHISVLLMMNGFILITMTALFYLIKFENQKFIISKNWGFLIPSIIGMVMMIFGGVMNVPAKNNEEIEKEIKILEKKIEELDNKVELEKRLNFESKIINLENKTK